MNSRLPALLVLSIAILAALPTYASAKRTQLSIIQDDARVVAAGDATRNATLDEMRALGADVVKVSISWRSVAGRRPANADDPNSYPAAKWAGYDAAITGAAARGMGVFVSITGPAPNWASKGGKGAVRPNAGAFFHFAKAVGTRYSGAFAPPGGAPAPAVPGAPCIAPPLCGLATAAANTLPAVHLWSVWNEPNLPVFLLPQRSSTKARYDVSPTLYRALYRAAHNGLSASGHGGDTILLGELLPVGKSPRTTHSSIRPLEFLRELTCVDKHYHAYRGKAAKIRGCKGYKALPLSGIAYHPYSLAGGPTVHPRNADDATIATLSRVTHVVDRLRARHRFAGPARLPLWLTEFGVQTDPPDHLFGAPIRRVPAYLGQSERLAMRNSRVYSYSQYPLVDDYSNFGFQSGLRFRNGKAKPGIYQEYKLPIYVTRRSGSSVDFWGGVRAADNGGAVTLLSRIGKKGKFTKLKTVTLGARGYFEVHARASSAAKRQYKFVFGRQSSIVVAAH